MKSCRSIVKAHSERGADGTFRPQLTSLIDVMTILLVFLIKSFSVEGNLITPSHDLELPLSSSRKPPKPVCALEITRTAILSDGESIIRLAEFQNADSHLVPRLFEWMLAQKAKCEDSKRAAEVLIQCDREIEFNVVKRVMFTCSRAGFVDFSVLVMEEE